MQTVETEPTVEPTSEHPDHAHEMTVLDDTGDTKVIWDSDNEDEVDAARQTFDALRKKGHMAYTVKRRGGRGEVITEFDPEAEKIIMAPHMVGG